MSKTYIVNEKWKDADERSELNEEIEKLKKQLEIAINALHGYNAYYDSNWSEDFEWFSATNCYIKGYELADKALNEIEELNK